MIWDLWTSNSVCMLINLFRMITGISVHPVPSYVCVSKMEEDVEEKLADDCCRYMYMNSVLQCLFVNYMYL